MLAHAAAVPADDGTASGGQLDGAPVQASPLPTPADLLPIFKQQVSAGLQKQYSMDPADAAAVADTVTMGPDVFPFDGAQLAALATCSPPVSAASIAEVLDIDVLDCICTSAFASKGSNFASAVMQRAGVQAAYGRQCRLRAGPTSSPDGSPRIVEVPHGSDGAEPAQPTTMLVGGIVNEHFYDDTDVTEPAYAERSGQRYLRELNSAAFLGFPFDAGKHVAMSESSEYLGVETSFERLHAGIITMCVTRKRRDKIADLIDEVLTRWCAPRSCAADWQLPYSASRASCYLRATAASAKHACSLLCNVSMRSPRRG